MGWCDCTDTRGCHGPREEAQTPAPVHPAWPQWTLLFWLSDPSSDFRENTLTFLWEIPLPSSSG